MAADEEARGPNPRGPERLGRIMRFDGESRGGPMSSDPRRGCFVLGGLSLGLGRIRPARTSGSRRQVAIALCLRSDACTMDSDDAAHPNATPSLAWTT